MAPVSIFKHGADEEKAETARLVGLFSFIFLIWIEKYMGRLLMAFVSVFFPLQSSFIGAIAIGDLVKSTLGPKGMVSSDSTVTGLLQEEKSEV